MAQSRGLNKIRLSLTIVAVERQQYVLCVRVCVCVVDLRVKVTI